MKTIRRLGTDAPVDSYRKTQRGSLRRMLLSEAEFRALKAERPEYIAVDGDAVLIAERLPDRVDLHYAFPDQASFAKQFAPMFERLLPLFTISDAPFGMCLRLTDRAHRPYVEPVLFAQAFQQSREWMRMELVELPAADPTVEAIAPGFRLRPARPDDAEAIVQLINVAFENPSVNPRSWVEALESGRQIQILENDTRQNAGLLHLRPEDAATGYVSELAVHPEYQRRGLGEALMRWALVWFREQGLRRAALTTNTDNARAIALYRKLGFTVAEIGVDYRRPIDEDEVRQVLEKHRGVHIRVRRAFP